MPKNLFQYFAFTQNALKSYCRIAPLQHTPINPARLVPSFTSNFMALAIDLSVVQCLEKAN